jgi:CheY-like chemotaxis protein
MGGDAGVESVVGHGSTFWFTARLKKAGNLVAEDMAIRADAETVLQQHFSGKRILVVDDEPMNQEVARMLLADTGLVIDAADDGEQAVAMVQRESYVAILMDMQMPKVDGLEATRRIREIPSYRSVPIIAITANAFAEDKVRCLAAGMDDFLPKPFEPDALFSTLLRGLSRSRHQR